VVYAQVGLRRVTPDAEVAVIGRGLMGTACARHLAEAGRDVVLIGPDEPEDAARHNGPFASHHDAGRITRVLAHDADWSRLAARSIARYRDIEARSAIGFYHPVGGMMAGPSRGPGAGFADAVLTVAETEGIAHDRLDDASLAARFPMLRFASGTRAAWDPVGGWIDPRAMRRSEERLAVAAGARVLRDVAVGRGGGRIALASGGSIASDVHVVATGGYAGMDALLPTPPRFDVFARTVAFAEVTQAEAEALRDMPSLVFVPEGQDHDMYLLPPIRYPDGRWRVKIGGEAQSPRLATPSEMTAWFRSGGSPEAGRELLHRLAAVMPDLPLTRTSLGACAVAFTPTAKPVIARSDAGTVLLAGGNGAGAKCADELGRLGALVAMGHELGDEGYRCSFGSAAQTLAATLVRDDRIA
jgi:sarcosine oxidase